MKREEGHEFDLAGCPAGCIEHYVAGGGAQNHSTAPRAVTGDSATREGYTVMVSTWLEQRHLPNGEIEVVGIIEKVREDGEFSATQLREFARHLLAIAAQIDVATALVHQPVVVPAVSEYIGDTPIEIRRSTIGGRSVHLHTGTSGEDLMLAPGQARRLGTALIDAAG